MTFAFRNDPSYYALDDVSVSGASSVPLPSSLFLFAPGLAGLVAIRRRFTK